MTEKLQKAAAIFEPITPAQEAVETGFEEILESPDFRRLLRALKRAQGFALYFVRCNLPVYRLELMARLRAIVGRPVIDVELPDDFGFLSALEQAAHASPPDAILFITGLERLVPSHDPQKRHQALDILNWQRGRLQRLHRPLIFWIPESIVRFLAEGAPDFWDWHSGLYEFAIPSPLRDTLFEKTVKTRELPEENLSESERHERLALLHSLLEEYATGNSPAELLARGRIAYKLGILYEIAGQSGDARRYYEQARDAFEDAGDESEKARAYRALGDIWVDYGNSQAARQYYEKALDIRAKLAAQEPNRADYARDLSVSYSKMGDLLRSLGEGSAARQYYEKALDIRLKLAAQEPNLLEPQLDLVVSFYKLGLISPPPVKRDYLNRGLQILRALQKNGKLPPANAGWLAIMEQELAQTK
ncbi:MAG: tetratricopeptide repeat protein [candidate division KSB1 bacterium]|nr:tetratricopeptide repeat protein [candidate division KSB1 bacterium]MDZ7296925.1 tetratricopeptide repeat protein [candidate division KSB1 bacterium]MDZ7347792.1 tetratricopeptide repeat protein [candidate division KSB1 bacterium]